MNALKEIPVKEESTSKKNLNEKTFVTIYDAIMGTGKTYDAIQRMKNYIKTGQKFIFVTPFLAEINRIQSTLGTNNVIAPAIINEFECYDLMDEDGNIDFVTFGRKKYRKLNKKEHFLKLIKEGKSIATTHSLLNTLSKNDIIDNFKDFILIIDEAINPISTFTFGHRDIEILFNEKLIDIDAKANKITVTDNHYQDDSFSLVLDFCKKENVYLHNNTFINLFPIEVLKAFKEVEILTYLFESSLMTYYFQLHKTTYKVVKNIKEDKQKKQIRKKLNIYIGNKNLNSRAKETSFSKNSLKKLSKPKAKKLQASAKYILRYNFKTNSYETAFTTFKEVKEKYAANGYRKGFIPINARASNEFAHKKSMIYIANRYLNPAILNFFNNNDIEIDEDAWALSELIQWLWRGSIRKGEKMNVYIPSYRMRILLIKWLNE